MNTQHDITVSGKPLNPPKPPAKPHMLLWIDTETTGISRTNTKLLEIGMIVTSMDGIEEHDRFIRPVRPDKLSLYDIDLLTNQLGPHLHPDWLRQLTNHRKLDLLALALWEANGERPTVYESGKAVADDVLEWWKQVAASAWGFINGTEAMQ